MMKNDVKHEKPKNKGKGKMKFQMNKLMISPKLKSLQ